MNVEYIDFHDLIDYTNFINQEDCDKYNMLLECNAIIGNKNKEIERLNNIIDELEKYICHQIMINEKCEVLEAKGNSSMVAVYNRDKRTFKMILQELKELKGDNK